MNNPQPEIADFILVRMGRPAGGFVRLLQKLNGSGFADYEHVALYAGAGLVEMSAGGIRLVNSDKYDNIKHRWSTGHIQLTGRQRYDIAASAVRYLTAGISYSWADYAALVLRRFHVPWPGLRAYIARTRSMICSQLLVRCYLDGGAPLYKRWTGYVTPGDLDKLLGPE